MCHLRRTLQPTSPISLEEEEQCRGSLPLHMEINALTCLHSPYPQTRWSCSAPGLRCHGEFHSGIICSAVETTSQTPPIHPASIQHQWNTKQKWAYPQLHWSGNADRTTENQATLLPHWYRQSETYLRISMVHSHPAKHQLGPKMDRNRATATHLMCTRKEESPHWRMQHHTHRKMYHETSICTSNSSLYIAWVQISGEGPSMSKKQTLASKLAEQARSQKGSREIPAKY